MIKKEFYICLLMVAFLSSGCRQSLKKETTEVKHQDTLEVNYTYWWSQSGPFIGMCGDRYSLAFTGIVREIDPTVIDTSLVYTPQKGIVEIAEVLKTRELLNDKYENQNYFSSDCFDGITVKKGDTVLVFCYNYEGSYSIPGKKSILKINGFDDSIVTSIKKYIKADQNPIVIKKDIELWEQVGVGGALKQLIECKEDSN